MKSLIQTFCLLVLLKNTTSPATVNHLIYWKNQEMTKPYHGYYQKNIEQHVTIRVSMDLTQISVHLDNKKIFSEEFEKPQSLILRQAGRLGFILVLVFHPKTFKVMTSKKFWTDQPTEDRNLVAFLKMINNNRIVILVGRPGFTLYLTSKAEQFLEFLGSVFIGRVAIKEPWIFSYVNSPACFSKENNSTMTFSKPLTTLEYLETIENTMKTNSKCESNLVLAEGLVTYYANGKEFGALAATFTIDKFPQINDSNNKSDESCPKISKRQREFCNSYDGYGNMCTCRYIYLPNKNDSSKSLNLTEEIPIIFVTANKPHNLYRLIRNLEMVPGYYQTKKLAVVDGTKREILSLLDLFDIPYKIHRPQGNAREFTRVNMNIGFALWTAFAHFSTVDKVIIIEDDLITSPDFLSYFHQTANLLTDNRNLSHVNAFSQNSFPQTANNLNTLLRVDMYPQYGWMTTRRWALRALQNWVPAVASKDWDWWLFLGGQKRNFEAIVPEISRTGHAGAVGTHVSGYDQMAYYHRRIMSSSINNTIENTERLSDQNYYSWMDRMIKSSIQLKMNLSPCRAFPLPDTMEGPFTIFLGVTSSNDVHKSFFLMQACLETEARDLKEIYYGVLRLNVAPLSRGRNTSGKAQILYLVGCPLSPFCKYSEKIVSWKIPSRSMIDEAMDKITKRVVVPDKRSRYRKKQENPKMQFQLADFINIPHENTFLV